MGRKLRKIAIFGASPDTGNMGVSALFYSTVSGVLEFIPDVSFVVMDNGWGKRTETHQLGENQSIEMTHIGVRGGRKYYKPENLATQSFLAGWGPLGAVANSVIRELDECDAILDVSGGDSFSDIYGSSRFLNVVRPKLIAIKRKIPLILMPQTYGPYSDKKYEKMAKKAVLGADMVWARDTPSFENMKALIGNNFNPAKHKVGIDLAFKLNKRSAEAEIGERIKNFISADRGKHPLIGFNVSGLIYQDPENARKHYGFKADYISLITDFFLWIFENTQANIVVIPHVMSPPGHYESDYGASLEVLEVLGSQYSDRITVSPNCLDQNQTKWLISKMDWFCGTRMHSTIAALSTGVPASAIAYSDKTKGVFETCLQGDEVRDPRIETTEEVVKNLTSSYKNRDDIRASLADALPEVLKQSTEQLKIISDFIKKC